MKVNKSLLIGLGIGLVVLFSSFLAQDTPTQYLTLRTIEFKSGIAGNSKLVIVDETGEVHNYDLNFLSSSTIGDNSKLISEVFNKLSKKGYTLVNSSLGSYGEDGLVGMYVFKK